MKGIVFSELIEMVEQDLGIETADRMIQNSHLSNQGAFTAVGTYDHRELLKMVATLSEDTGVPVPTLVQTFGRYLFSRFSELYPVFFEGVQNSLEFLGNVDHVIHLEVRKLYPDAELPKFEMHRLSPDVYELQYSSQRPLADLAEGLILACIEYFDDSIDVKRTDLANIDGTNASFELRVLRVRDTSQTLNSVGV